MTSIVADLIRVEGEDRLIASGNIEIHADGKILRAERLSYDKASNRLDLSGPIFLQDGADVIVLADSASLDRDLENGVMTGVRLVLEQQLQIAGAEMARSSGRFSDLKQVVASSCEVCADHQKPLWEIRARRVIHDQQESLIYFYGARFHIVGVPVMYLPAMYLPDGSNPRVNGFLTPTVTSTSQLGVGLKLPYFFTLGDSADLTLTPYYAVDETRTLEARYRQVFANGEIEFEGALSRDSIIPDTWRGYIFGEGTFDIPRGYELTFDIETTLDDPYLGDYDYSNKDRLDSALGILRTKRGERIEAEAVYYQSLRSDEDNDEVPTFVVDAAWDRRFQPASVGGWLDLDLIAHGHMRPSNEDIVGRDQSQIRATAAWSRNWTSFGGLRFGADALVNADFKQIMHDSEYDQNQFALTPTAAVDVSLPLARQNANGVRHLLEPIAQLVWTPSTNLESPNDDSTLVTFDTGNLISLNRFPGLDRYEEGVRANLALRWTRMDPDGWTLGVTMGRVYRTEDLGQFSSATGLAGTTSDWMSQVDLDFGSKLTVRNLLLMDNAFDATYNETRVTWLGNGLDLSSSYLWQREDRGIDLNEDLSEVSLDAEYDLDQNWSGKVDLRRDLIAERTNRAKLELTWRNECVRVDFSVQRRFRSTEDIEATTSYGLAVTLAGFGNDQESTRARRCAK